MNMLENFAHAWDYCSLLLPRTMSSSAFASCAASAFFIPMFSLWTCQFETNNAAAGCWGVCVHPNAPREVFGPGPVLWRLDLFAPAVCAAATIFSGHPHLEWW